MPCNNHCWPRGESLLKLHEASFAYGQKVVLKNVNLTINSGDFYVFEGENGAGKSTLMDGLLGRKAPSSGFWWMADVLKNEGIGFLEQTNEIQSDFPASVGEVLRTGLLKRQGWRLFNNAEEKALMSDALHHFGLTDLVKTPLRELSGGQRRRALIARAYLASSRLLVLDEPTNGLDTHNAKVLLDLLINLNHGHGTAILLVTHDISVRDTLYIYGARRYLVANQEVRDLTPLEAFKHA